ncbi:hypothetical protein ABT369_09255 [Dactylosporangium sp. NPDC000244]|uniref:type VII secretion protein EccE n=1 Tax=Dactylosporangium sp. NPDC000244 TaxID=3154365 RepID=UPI00332DEB02
MTSFGVPADVPGTGERTGAPASSPASSPASEPAPRAPALGAEDVDAELRVAPVSVAADVVTASRVAPAPVAANVAAVLRKARDGAGSAPYRTAALLPETPPVVDRPPRPGPVPPPRRPVRRSAGTPLGRVSVLQVVCWYLVLVAVALAWHERWPAVVGVALAAVVVLGLTAVRHRDRWGYEWLHIAVRYHLRDRAWDLPGAGATGGALLRRLAPEVTAVADGDHAVHMLSRAEGVTAVLQAAGRNLTAAMPAAAALLPAREGPEAFAVQVIHHAGLNRAQPPRIWVAVQALRTAERYRDAELSRALGNTVRRVQRRLRRDGLAAKALAEHEALGTIAALAHVNAGRGSVREHWRGWRTGPVEQAVFRLGDWDRLPPAAAAQLLGRLLTAAPEAAVTVAVTARRAPAGTMPVGRVPVGSVPAGTEPVGSVRSGSVPVGTVPGERMPVGSATLRIAATSCAALERAEAELARLVREGGAGIERLDGRHARGVAATLPLGLVNP